MTHILASAILVPLESCSGTANVDSIYARVRGLVFEFKNARDLNDVKNRHLRLFSDQIGCDRSNDT